MAGRISAISRSRVSVGIFLADREPDRRIPVPVSTWGPRRGSKVPGEYRADLQRLLVVQGDTEPGVS